MLDIQGARSGPPLKNRTLELQMPKFQTCLALLLAAAIASPASTALAADWPAAQPIKLVVPSAAGGTPDQTSRKLANYLQDKLKQSVIVENRPGAAGTIAMQAVATAKPDGYTLGFGNIVTMAINRGLIAKICLLYTSPSPRD